MKGSSNDDLSLGIRVRQVTKFVIKSIWEVFHECGAAGKDDVIVKINLKVGVTLLDGFVC